MNARIAIVDDEIMLCRRLKRALAGVVRVEDQPRTTLWRKIKE